MESHEMKEFIKKVIYFDIVNNLADIFFSNTFLFEDGKIFRVIVDAWTFIFFIGWFFYGIIAIGIIKFLSVKVNKFMYESDKFICYMAFILRGSTWFNVAFCDFSNEIFWQIFAGLTSLLCFVVSILFLFRFWKYHVEINAGVFLTAFIYAFTHWEVPFYMMFNIVKPSYFLRGLFILGILVIFLSTVIFLRKKGLYDFRSRKDKLMEVKEEGPYQKNVKVIWFLNR
jgi:hypothetical protein